MPHVADLMIADGADFVSRSVPVLSLTLNGIEGDRHAGATRRADARTPWHKRGTRIANTRQISVVSVEECTEIAVLLGVPTVAASLLGANLLIAGVTGLSLVRPGSRLLLRSGATVLITEQNAPCRHPAVKIGEAFGRPRLAAGFARAAVGRRGLVGIVEREGPVGIGDVVRVIASPAQVERPRILLDRMAFGAGGGAAGPASANSPAGRSLMPGDRPSYPSEKGANP